MMQDDPSVTEVVILDNIMAILYVGRQSAGEGLMEKEAGACIDHFSPYIEWREVAIKREFQALTLAEAHEEIHAYEDRTNKSLRGQGQPKAMKPLSPWPIQMPMGLDSSPREFGGRRKENKWSDSYNDCYGQALRQATLHRNNSTSGQQLP